MTINRFCGSSVSAVHIAAADRRRIGGRYALAAQCIGGGQGIATILEKI